MLGSSLGGNAGCGVMHMVLLHHLQNKKVCVDLLCWMVQLQNVSKSHGCVKEKVYLRGLFHLLRARIALSWSVVFIAGCASLSWTVGGWYYLKWEEFFQKELGRFRYDESSHFAIFCKCQV